MCGGHKVSWLLVVVGALNWGLVGAFHFNLVNKIFGSVNWLERLVYILVGLAGIMMILSCKCKACGMGGGCQCGKADCPQCGSKKM